MERVPGPVEWHGWHARRANVRWLGANLRRSAGCGIWSVLHWTSTDGPRQQFFNDEHEEPQQPTVPAAAPIGPSDFDLLMQKMASEEPEQVGKFDESVSSY